MHELDPAQLGNYIGAIDSEVMVLLAGIVSRPFLAAIKSRLRGPVVYEMAG